MEKILYIWLAILVISIFLVPEVATWGAAWSCVGGYDLSKLPLVIVIGVIFLVVIEVFASYRKRK